MKHIKQILLFSFLALVIVVNGQNTTISEQDTTSISEEIDEITITAFRSPYNLFNTPAPVNLITSLQLETGRAMTPIEALNQVPGVLMHNGTFNTNRLTIRGIGSRSLYGTNKIKAYFGEIPLTSGDGETTLEDLENSAIKRIEIIKGPSSSLYGAGLAGVILFHPKSVIKNFAQNQTSVASFGTLKNTLSVGVAENSFNLFALASVLKSDGYRDNNATKRLNFLINTQYLFTERTNLQLLLKSTKMKGFIPSSIDLATFLDAPENAAYNWKSVEGYEDYISGQFGISFNHFTRRSEKISAAMFGSFREADELRPFNMLDESSNFIGWRAYIQKVIDGENSRFTITSGLEFFRERYNWSTYTNENLTGQLSENMEKRQYENLFVQMESSFFDLLFISTGFNGNLTRFDYTDRFQNNGDQSGRFDYKPVISPRLGLNLLIQKDLSLFGNVSHGFSTPTFEETLMPEGNLNKDIKPESGWNIEFGFRSQFADRLQLSASYYKIFIRNLLVARRTGEDAYIGVNAGKSVHPGVETELKWQVFNPNTFPSLTLMGNATFANYHFEDFVDEGENFSQNLLPGTAKNTWFVMGNIKPSEKTEINIWHRYTGRMPFNDANSGFSDAYGISNVDIKYSGDLNKLKYVIKAGIQNLFDIKYASMILVNAPSFGGRPPRYYYPGNPRNYFIAIIIGL